jgi:opacity protein-like surface antigen
MRHVVRVFFCLLCLPVAAQEFPKAEIFGGYSFMSVGNKDLSSRQSLNGWEASASGNLTKWFAVEGDVSGHYKSVSVLGVSATTSDYTFAGGPRVNFKPVFAHVLVGGDRVSASAFGFSASHDGLSVAAGGGVEYGFSPHLAARVSADYVMDRHNVSIPGVGSTTVTFNNVRVSAGIVYTFGGTIRETSRKVTRVHGANPAVLRIPEFGLEADTAEPSGARVISVSPSGSADRAGLRATDVIQEIDGKRVQSAQDLAAQLSAEPAGARVQVKYLRGYWQSETTVTLEQR